MGYNDKYPDMSAMYAVQFEYENKLKDRIKELETELEDTRKTLDAARDGVVFFRKRADIAMRALAKISKQDTDWCNKGYLVAIARDALEQITAEQKEE